MYKIYADGELLYASEYQEAETLVLGPTCSVEVGKTGSLDFTMLPGHYLYDNLHKLKTRIVAYMDGVEIFRGRVLDWTLDFYNQKKVHCESSLAYLLDSLQPPRKVKMAIAEYFRRSVEEHNIQVEAEKRFTVGDVTIDNAADEADFDDSTYRDTRSLLENDLLNVYGGFLRTRTVGETVYLDYVKDYGAANTQKLEFGSNLLDLTASLSATDIFTVLLPTGKTKESGNKDIPSWPLTIETVNGGSKLIEYLEGIAKYGRIVRTQSFDQADTPEKLYAAGIDYFAKTFKEPPLVLEVSALDLHLMDSSVEQIMVGQMVQVVSPPHNIDVSLMCLSIQYDFENPENSQFKLGTPDKPSIGGASGGTSGGGSAPISSSVGKTSGGPGGGTVAQQYKYIKEALDSIEIATNNINLKVDKDGVCAAINASTEGVKIYGKNITMVGGEGLTEIVGAKIGKNLEVILDEAFTRVKATENSILHEVVRNGKVISAINADHSGVTIVGAQIQLTGPEGILANIIAEGNLMIKGELTADLARITALETKLSQSGSANIGTLIAQKTFFSNMYYQGHLVSLKTIDVVTGVWLYGDGSLGSSRKQIEVLATHWS